MPIITNKKAHIQTWPLQGTSVIKCLAGETQVTLEQFKLLSGHPVFSDFVKKGIISISYTDEEKETDEKKKPIEKPVDDSPMQDGFEQLSQRELIKLISEMTDKVQLESLIKDSRTRVAEAAKQQLESL